MNAPIHLQLKDMFRIGPGPSSSHTMGPMLAARAFRRNVLSGGIDPDRVTVGLLGSLNATGRGHGTHRAVMAGLLDWHPKSCDCHALWEIETFRRSLNEAPWSTAEVHFGGELPVGGELPHANTMVLTAFGKDGGVLREEVVCSVGGGFIQSPNDIGTSPATDQTSLPHPFLNASDLVAAATAAGTTMGRLVLENERAMASGGDDVETWMDGTIAAFRTCIESGLKARGTLPGGLKLPRRAAELRMAIQDGEIHDSFISIAKAQSYAYAICEENASGGRVVTAPTNGAAGIFPAVLIEVADRRQLDALTVHEAFATAGAIAMIIKRHGSLSGAEVGCQGEVGSATAMAAAALCQILGGTPQQVENAAEIGLEHNLGLTCDPIGGLVQAPCIERNAMGVAKAWSAAWLARTAPHAGIVSLDKAIRVMKRTGLDMCQSYKETSAAGLAVAVIEC